MSWPQSNYSDPSYSIHEGFYDMQPYSVALSTMSIPATSPKTMVHLHSASYPDNFTTPRYQPGSYLQTSPQQGQYSFDNYTWQPSSTTRGRSDSGDSNLYVASSAASISTSPREDLYGEGASTQYSIHADHNIQQEQISRKEHHSTRVALRHDEDKTAAVHARTTISPSSDKTLENDNSKQPLCCTHPECLGLDGLPQKFFSRKADVTRHYNSQHTPTHRDCPKKNCTRKGTQGFTRKDHLTEHLRGFHMDNIPKRESGHSRRDQGNSITNDNSPTSPMPQKYSQNVYHRQSSGGAGVKHERLALTQYPLYGMNGLPETENADSREDVPKGRVVSKRARTTANRHMHRNHPYELSNATSGERGSQNRKGTTLRLGHTTSRTTNVAQVTSRPSAQQSTSSDFMITGLSPRINHPHVSPLSMLVPPTTCFPSMEMHV